MLRHVMVWKVSYQLIERERRNKSIMAKGNFAVLEIISVFIIAGLLHLQNNVCNSEFATGDLTHYRTTYS